MPPHLPRWRVCARKPRTNQYVTYLFNFAACSGLLVANNLWVTAANRKRDRQQ